MSNFMHEPHATAQRPRAPGALAAIAQDAARGAVAFPSHTRIVLLIQAALDDPDCSIDELIRLIAAEPMLSASVVAVANSVAYRRSGGSTTDVKNAVATLGFQMVRSLAAGVVVRQMASLAKVAEHRRIAAQLWQHSAHVATLARVIARRVVRSDPEIAFFAGIVHEAGGFYLIARAAEFPGLLEGGLRDWDNLGEAAVGAAVLRALGVPNTILDAAVALWNGYLSFPPATLGDALILADQLAPDESPLSRLAGTGRAGARVDIDLALGSETLTGILEESAAEVASLRAALQV